MNRKSRLALSAAVLVSVPFAALAQRPMPMGAPGVTQPLTPDQIARENPPNALSGAAVDKSVVLKGMGGMSIRVVKLAEGLSHPDGLVFLPDGHTMLITERAGRLRVVNDGVLDPNPVAGVPAMIRRAGRLAGYPFCIPTSRRTVFCTSLIQRTGNPNWARPLRSRAPGMIKAD